MHKIHLYYDLVVASPGVLFVFGVAVAGVTWAGVILGDTGRYYGDQRCRGARTRYISWTFTPPRLEQRMNERRGGGESTVHACLKEK